MTITTDGYNIPSIKILEDFQLQVPQEVGTVKQFNQLYSIISKSKVCFLEFTMGNTKFHGLALCYYVSFTTLNFILLDVYQSAFRFTSIGYFINQQGVSQMVIEKVKTIT